MVVILYPVDRGIIFVKRLAINSALSFMKAFIFQLVLRYLFLKEDLVILEPFLDLNFFNIKFIIILIN